MEKYLVPEPVEGDLSGGSRGGGGGGGGSKGSKDPPPPPPSARPVMNKLTYE